MKYIDNRALREYVKEELRVSIFQMAHKLAIQTGCEIIVKLEDTADHSGCQYYATRTLNLQYMDKGLSKQPWEVLVSGITGLPVANYCGQSEDRNGSLTEETEDYTMSNDGHDMELDNSAEMSFTNNLSSESLADVSAVSQEGQQSGQQSSQTIVHVIKTEPGNSQLPTAAEEDSWTKTTVTLPFPVALETALRNQAGGVDATNPNQSMDADQIQQQIYIYANTNTEIKDEGEAAQDDEADDAADPHRHRTPPSLNYQCSLCKKRVSSVPLLVRHAKLYHASDESMRYHCVPCNREYKHARHLEQHTELHSKASYRCSMCCKGFYRSSTLREHELRDHQGRYRYYCPKCHKGFMRPSTMQTHLNRTHPSWFNKSKASPRAAAAKMSKTTDSVPGIVIPVNKDGMELKSLCTTPTSDEVPSTSADQGQEPQAADQVSGGAAPSDSEIPRTTVNEELRSASQRKMMKVVYQCKECGRMYDNANSLVRHIHDRHDSHTKLRCNQCSYRTSRTSDLSRHKRAKHPAGGTPAAAQPNKDYGTNRFRSYNKHTQ